MKSSTVLMVGGAEALRNAVVKALSSRQHRLENVEHISDAIGRAQVGDVAIAIVAVSGLREAGQVARLLKETAKRGRTLATVVISDLPDAEVTLRFMQMGVIECLHRPLDLGRLSFLVDMITAGGPTLSVGAPRYAGKCDEIPRASGEVAFLYDGPGMRAMMEQVRRVAPLDTTVLLTGETGSGKTSLSRIIHAISPRADKPFLTVTCAACSSTLVESELFGHVRGAFTGADRDHTGKFGQAQDGTLLLDDVDLLSPEIQAKLLRVVDERVYEPVGSEGSQKFSARLIVATNKSLEALVAAGRFREDLLYRLNVLTFHLPPLRERRSVIPHLASRFVLACSKHHGLVCRGLSPDALAALEAFDWPGNVRQLRNVIEGAVIRCGGSVISLEVLPEAIRNCVAPRAAVAGPAATGARSQLAQARASGERDKLVEALRRNGNNRSSTALELGISRTALYKKLRRFQLA